MKIRWPVPNSRSIRDALRDVRMRHRPGLDWRVRQVEGDIVHLIYAGEEHRMDYTPELHKLIEERHKP